MATDLPEVGIRDVYLHLEFEERGTMKAGL